MGRFGRTKVVAAVAAVAMGSIAYQAAPSTASGVSPSAAFSVQAVIGSNLLQGPVAAVTAPDGRIFVAQLGGIIKVFHGVSDTHPKVFADLSNEVYSAQGHGLLGLTLDPKFATNHYVYALFSRDSATLGGPIVTTNKDKCTTHATTGCVRYGRLARLTASGDKMVAGSEKKLLDDWCNQFVHHIGALHFGKDGALYVSGGDGATEADSTGNIADYGQFANACADPPSPKGTNLTPPTAQGGSLRAQDMLTGYNSDPVTLDGTVVRVPVNAPSQRKIVAWGLRNPFRFTIRPGTNDLYVSDPGLTGYEEIDRVANPAATAPNFGWPCWEGPTQQSLFKAKNLDMCNSLYAANSDTKPFFSYQDSGHVVSGDSCTTVSGAITGVSFYSGTSYPAVYKNALFFADYGRECLFAMPAGAGGVPNHSAPQVVTQLPAVGVTDIEPGPNGDLLLVDVNNGTIYELHYG